MEEGIEKYIGNLIIAHDEFAKRSDDHAEKGNISLAMSYCDKELQLKTVINDLKEIIKEEREATK